METSSPQFHLERAIALDPAFADPHFQLALYQLAKLQAAPAIDHLQKAITLGVNSAEASASLALAASKNHRFDRAKWYLVKSRGHHRLAAQASYRLGLLQLEDGALADAGSSFEQAIRYDPGHADAQYQLGRLHQQAGLADQARARFEKSVALDFAHSRAHFALAEVITAADENHLALNHYLTALDLDGALAATALNERFGLASGSGPSVSG